jgi:hypothetical protein
MACEGHPMSGSTQSVFEAFWSCPVYRRSVASVVRSLR